MGEEGGRGGRTFECMVWPSIPTAYGSPLLFFLFLSDVCEKGSRWRRESMVGWGEKKKLKKMAHNEEKAEEGGLKRHIKKSCCVSSHRILEEGGESHQSEAGFLEKEEGEEREKTNPIWRVDGQTCSRMEGLPSSKSRNKIKKVNRAKELEGGWRRRRRKDRYGRTRAEGREGRIHSDWREDYGYQKSQILNITLILNRHTSNTFLIASWKFESESSKGVLLMPSSLPLFLIKDIQRRGERQKKHKARKSSRGEERRAIFIKEEAQIAACTTL